MRVIVFNVYPYRDRLKKGKTARVLTELGVGALLALGVVVAISSDFSSRLALQSTYKTELSRMEGEIATRVARVQAMKDEVQDLRRKVEALESVERESLVASTVMSYLDVGMPRTVGLKKMSLTKGVMLIQGVAESVPQLASWVQAMEQNAELFKRVDLMYVRDVEQTAAEKPKDAVVNLDLPHQFEVRLELTGASKKTATQELAHVSAQ